MLDNENIEIMTEEAERIGRQVADAYNNGWMDSLRKSDTEVVRAFNERYTALKYQLDFGLITEEEYYDGLEQLRDNFFARDTQEWYKYTNEIYNYRITSINEYTDAVEENLNSLIETVKNAHGELSDEYAAFYNETQAYNKKLLNYAGSPTGFDTHTTIVDNYWPTGDPVKIVDYSLVDYDEEIKKLQDFNNSINLLKERAASIDPEIMAMFFEDIRNMSVDDAKILTDLLLEASDEDFNKHFQLYDERNRVAENIATDMYSGEYGNFARTMMEEFTDTFSELPEEFFKYGQSVGENFSEGIKTGLSGVIDNIIVEAVAAGSEVYNTNNVQNTEFSPVYYFFGERATTSRTRMMARNDTLFNYMRGLE